MKVPPRIGFIGIGIMGFPMAKNLIKNGYKIKVYNRTREKCYELEKEGAEISATIKEISQLSNVIITMLENEKAMDDVCFGECGVIKNLSAGSYFINMSTVSYDYTLRLKNECFKRGIRFCDCPVSGSKPVAESGNLIILYGGEEEDLDYLKPILLSMGKDIVYCGKAGNGTILKLSVNLLLAFMSVGLVESARLCEKSGLSVELLFEVLEKSPVLNCGYYKIKKEKIISRNFEPQFSLKNMFKDLRFIKELGERNGLKLVVGEKIYELYRNGFNEGFMDEDLLSVYKLYCTKEKMDG